MSIGNTNNCIIFNSILFHSDSTISGYMDPFSVAMRKFQEWNSHTKTNINYYHRAEKIVSLIKEHKGHTTLTWDHYYQTYVKDIETSALASNFGDVVKKIEQMVISCEEEFGIVTQTGGVCVNSYIPFSETALQDINVNDKLLILKNNLNEIEIDHVSGFIHTVRPLVTLISSSGIRLTCAASTPLTLEFGDILVASSCKGRNIPVMDNNTFRWEPCIDVIHCGQGEVVNIITDDPMCYAAGDEKNRWIWTQRISK